MKRIANELKIERIKVEPSKNGRTLELTSNVRISPIIESKDTVIERTKAIFIPP